MLENRKVIRLKKLQRHKLIILKRKQLYVPLVDTMTYLPTLNSFFVRDPVARSDLEISALVVMFRSVWYCTFGLLLSMLSSRSRHLAAGIKAKVMTTSFLPLCPPQDVDSDLTVSIP